MKTYKLHDSSGYTSRNYQNSGSIYSSREGLPRHMSHMRIPCEFTTELYEPYGISEDPIRSGELIFKNIRTRPPRAKRSYLLNLDKNHGLNFAYLGTTDRLTATKCRSMEFGSRTQGNSDNFTSYKDITQDKSDESPQTNQEYKPDIDYGSREGDCPEIKSLQTRFTEYGNSYRGAQSGTIYLDERKQALRYNVEGQFANRGYEGDKDFMRSISGLDSQAAEIAISRYLAQRTIVPQIDPIQNGYPGPSPGPFDGDIEGAWEQFPRIPSLHPGITSPSIAWGALNRDQQIEQLLHSKITSRKQRCPNTSTNSQRVSFICH